MRSRVCLALALTLSIALSAKASDKKVSKEHGLRRITYSSLRPGDYVRLAFGEKKIVITGMVEKVKPESISIDLSFSEEGLAGVATIRRKEILWLRRLPPLSPSKVEKLRGAFTKEAEEARKALKAYEERLAKEELSEEEAEAKVSPEEVPSGLTPEQIRLLTDFPPEEGWGLAKFNEIRRDWIIYDVPPTDKERNFLQVFPDWDKAYKALPPETQAPPERGEVWVERLEESPAEKIINERITR